MSSFPDFDTLVATVPRNPLVIKPSSIEGAGLGLFAGRDYKKGEVITFYDGEIISHAEAKRREAQSVDTHIRSHIQLKWDIDGRLVDPNDPSKGKASFINHKPRGEGANVEFDHVDTNVNKALLEKFLRGQRVELDPRERRTFVYALRSIRKGEEFFVNYGKDYGFNDSQGDQDDDWIVED